MNRTEGKSLAAAPWRGMPARREAARREQAKRDCAYLESVRPNGLKARQTGIGSKPPRRELSSPGGAAVLPPGSPCQIPMDMV